MAQTRKTSRRKKPLGDCTIPTHVPVAVANEVAFGRNEHEAEEIRQYVFQQTNGETVTHLERLASEVVHNTKIEGWNVWTDKQQYWVVTNPTNLYEQKTFPSLDYTITFHIGLATRISARQAREAPDPQRERLATAARKWEQASEAFGHAAEAEEFQIVGMRCRECLVSMAKAIASPSMVPTETEAPKGADFVNWSELIANHIAKGSSSDYVRGYLKGIAKPTWQLVNWLTHTSSAVRFDAQLALDATQSVLSAFAMALFRHESDAPERCPKCNSYRISTIYEPLVDSDQEYFSLCQACGWNDIPADPHVEAAPLKPARKSRASAAK